MRLCFSRFIIHQHPYWRSARPLYVGARGNPSDPMAVPSDRERNLVQELARVITQANPYEKSAPTDNHSREQTASGGYDEEPSLPPAPQLAREQACELHDDSAYVIHYKPCTAKKAQQKESACAGPVAQ